MSQRLHKMAGFVRPLRTRAIAVFLLAVLCAGTAVAGAAATYRVDIVDDGVVQTVSTVKTEADKILEQLSIEVAQEDKVDTTGFTGRNGSKIIISRAHDVTVTDMGQTYQLRAAGTAQDAVLAAGITLTARETLSCRADAPLEDGMVIRVMHEMSINIIADGKTQSVTVTADTVEEALVRTGVTLGENDEVVPAKGTLLSNGMSITVGRVSYAERTVENEVIQYETVTKESASMFKGESKIETEGQNGLRNVTYRDKIIDGKIAESNVVTETVLQPAVNEVKVVGTKNKLANIKLKTNSPISGFQTPNWMKFDANGLPTNYKSIIEGKAAAYTGGGRTSTGKKAQPGYIAVNPKQIPYGTEMYIVSMDGKYVYGYCIAADTGGFAQKGTFTVDLYMNTLSECYQWGARQVRIYLF